MSQPSNTPLKYWRPVTMAPLPKNVLTRMSVFNEPCLSGAFSQQLFTFSEFHHASEGLCNVPVSSVHQFQSFKTKQFGVLCNRPLLTLNAWWGSIRQTASPVDGDPWVPFVAITPTLAAYWLNLTSTTLRQMTCNFSRRNFVKIKFFTQPLTSNLQPWTEPTSLLVNQWE